jgi:hypothetical protein
MCIVQRKEKESLSFELKGDLFDFRNSVCSKISLD